MATKPRTHLDTSPADAAREALERRREQRKKVREAVIDVTIEQRAIAAVLRERDHRDGCPAYTAPDGAARIEAYAERAIAPGGELKALGIQAGDMVIAVRCHECGGIRHREGYERHHTPEAALEAFTDDRLEQLAGVTADALLDTDLD